MHKQNYTLCCKNTCCKQDDSQWKNYVGCRNYTKDTRNRTCVTGPSKGFVQNLKDKLTNLQNDSLQLQFVKRPIKKKQKDYYCLMLRKINNLDKKLQNLENLFVSHLNHTPNEVFNSSGNDPLYNYMDFYDSVRSLVNLANSLKEDILYKQGNTNMPHRNVIHINDRIQVLDSELQNLYTYLDQLQNCASEIKDAKQYFVQEDYQNFQYNYPAFRGGSKVDKKKYTGFNGFQNKRKKHPKRNEDNYSIGHPSPHCMECYEGDDDTPVDCQCSMCNVHATIFSMTPPGNRRYSPKRFQHCAANNSDCSCELCANETKKKFQMRKNNVWVSRSNSLCSCEICIGNNKKSYNNNCNNARIKIIKPVKKGLNEENLLSELQISYHELGPSVQGKKKKKESKKGKLNTNEEDQDSDLETIYYQDIGPDYKGNDSTTVSNIKSGDSINLKQTQGKVTKTKYSKTVSDSNNQQRVMKNIVYYELTPDLNIITKKKNNTHPIHNNSAQRFYEQRNKSDKKNKKTISTSKDGVQRNVTYRVHTGNFDLTEEESSNKFPRKVVKNKKNNIVSSEKENVSNLYQANSLGKKNPAEPMGLNKNDGATEKHLHIKFRKNKELKEGMTIEKSMKRSPEYEYNYTNKHSKLQHRRHGGFCHFRNPKDGRQNGANKRCSYPYPYYSGISESDSFESLEEYENCCGSCSSQYKLFICNDPNCVEKLSSDELIMLMNKTDLKSCGENLYQLHVSESVKDLKSDVCDKCTIKEKTISVIPHKTKTRNNNEKAKIIIKKETVECFNCKKNNSKDLSETIISDGSFGSEKNERTGNTPSRIKKSVKNPNKNVTNNRESKNKIEKNQESNQFLFKKDSSLSSFTDIDQNNKKTYKLENKGTHDKDFIVVHSNLNQSTSHKMLRGNESVSSKPLELQGFGNMININIDRGSYCLTQQPSNGEAEPLLKTSSVNKDNNLKLISQTREYEIENITSSVSKIPLLSDINEFSSNTNNVTDKSFRNRVNKPNTHTFYSESIKSSSALDIRKDSGKEIKEVTSVKSEIFANVKDGMKSHCNNIKLPLYVAQVNSVICKDDHNKDGKMHSKKDNARKKMSLNYFTKKNPGSVLISIKDSNYIYDRPSKTQSAIKRKKFNRVSSTRLKSKHNVYDKQNGSYLNNVPSVNSFVQKGIIYPDDEVPYKKSNIYNTVRRVYGLPKHKQHVYPRISSLSGIIKPQVKIVEQISYQNDFKIPPNDASNSRYRIASISNYLSSTVEAESSFSTLNWEKVANKLKEDNTYYNNIA